MTIHIGARSAAIVAGSAIFADPSVTRIDDPRIGIVPYSTGVDQGAKLQAAIELAKDETGVLETWGLIENRSVELDMGTDTPIRIVGQNRDTSIWKYPVDLGAGKYALKMGGGWIQHVEHLQLCGSQVTVANGQKPMQMSGVYMPGNLVLNDVLIRSFGSAVAIVNDHQRILNSDLQGNGYGLDFIDNPEGGLGDVDIRGTHLSNQKIASIGISESNTMANVVMSENLHMGFAPFAVHRYPSKTYLASGASGDNAVTAVAVTDFVPTVGDAIRGKQGTDVQNGTTITSVAGTPGNYTLGLSKPLIGNITTGVRIGARITCMVGVMMLSVSREYCGHAAFWDEVAWINASGGDDASFGNLVLESGGESSTGVGPQWGAGTGPGAGSTTTDYGTTVPDADTLGAGIVVGTFDAVHWRSSHMTVQATRAQVRARKISNIRVDNFSDEANNQFGNTTYRIFKLLPGAADPPVTGITLGTAGPGSGGLRCSSAKTTTDLVQYDLVQADGYGNVKTSLNDATSEVLGFAMQHYTSGEVADWVAQHRSSLAKVNNYTGANITAGKLLKPDPAHPGGVIAADDASAKSYHPVVGRAISTLTPGTAVGDVKIHVYA